MIAPARLRVQYAPPRQYRRDSMTMRNRPGPTMSQRLGGRSGQALAALALLALLGCDQIGNPFVVLGSKAPAPDEFQVLARKPLRMPASAALPEPRPGAPSPLDPDPNRDAVVALLGTNAAPRATGVSGGERALLSAADVAASNPEIRQTLAEESDGSNEPYEPPSVFELLGAYEAPPEDVIDAGEESRRLQREGVAAAPIDPADRPVVEAEEQVEQPSPYPEVGADRRPNNRPLSTVEPAFE
jgi:hypothetical protein